MSGLVRKRARDGRLDAESLEQLVLVCLQALANVAQSRGQQGRAARLLDAATLLRDELQAAAPGDLSAREHEVASLITRGYSNRHIARELVISERTVDSHVSNILRKLSLGSRAQIAAWVVRRQPRLRVLG
jgi:DNA-binding NarL/FixJ family response regulator